MFDVPRLRSHFCALLIGVVVAQTIVVSAQSTNASSPLNYSTFAKFITERNIFNPNRYARAANTPYRPRTRAVRRNSFGLAGTMSYDEGETAGRHAFFDGTSADYRKVLQVDGTVAVFKITDITADSVTLVLDTNTTVLKIGQQMRDDGRGHWALSTEILSYAQNAAGGRRSETGGAPPSENSDTNSVEGLPDSGMEEGEPAADAAEPAASSAPTEAAPLPSGPGSDALRRLMELRAQEEQQSGNRN